MSFVEWTVAVALLALALGGGYAGIMLLTRRSIEAPPYKFEGRGVFLLALLYFGEHSQR